MAAAFVAFRASEKLVQEKGEIIGLLLGEFEQTTSDWIWASMRMAGRTGFRRVSPIRPASRKRRFWARTSSISYAASPRPTIRWCPRSSGTCWRDGPSRTSNCGSWRAARNAGGASRKTRLRRNRGYLGYLGTGSDVTERKMADMRITLLAHHDPMTGLLNRTKFTEQLSLSVARLESLRHPVRAHVPRSRRLQVGQRPLGHLAGDRVLTEMSRRIGGEHA